MFLVIKMEQIYDIYIEKKENLISTILEEMDNVIFEKQNANPIFKLHLINFELEENELFQLLNELIISKHKLIADIVFDKKEDANSLSETKSSDKRLVIYGDVEKNTTFVINEDLYVYGEVKGNIVLQNQDLTIYASKFTNANIISKETSIFIEDKKNYTIKI